MATVKSLTAAKKRNPEKFARVFKKVKQGAMGGLTGKVKYSGAKPSKSGGVTVNDARKFGIRTRLKKFREAARN